MTTPSVVLALAGFGVVGLGLANVFPLAVARAGALWSRGIALSTTVGYTGLLGGPPAIGFLAAHAGLPVALGTVALLAGAAAVLVALVDGDRVRVPEVDLAPVHRPRATCACSPSPDTPRARRPDVGDTGPRRLLPAPMSPTPVLTSWLMRVAFG